MGKKELLYCKFLDIKTGETMQKYCSSQGLGALLVGYKEVLNRIVGDNK